MSSEKVTGSSEKATCSSEIATATSEKATATSEKATATSEKATAPRDAQRAKVYEAEQLVRRLFDRAEEHQLRTVQILGSRVTLPAERKFASAESVQAYADAVLGLNWVRARWARAASPISVRPRAGNAAAHYDIGTATLAVPLHTGNTAWALRELVVLHELSHHLQPPTSEVAPHGPEFASLFVTLVGEILGHEAGFVLRTTMLENGVQFG